MPVTIASVDLERLSRRYTSLQMRFSALQGRASELELQKARLTKDISLAKARIELAPQAAEVFNYLQEQAHARAVGEFEDLLSAFVADVVPDAGKIHLELGTERNAPALDILLDNGGDMENILDGNGGGLTNVVVTGLGYSALSRTANRQLMLLDEPDCWLKAKYVPNFTKVIAEVANPRTDEEGHLQAGCQTLMISHNDIGLMDDGAHIQDLRIERDLAAYAARLGVSVVYKGDAADCAHVVWVPGVGASRGHIEVRYRTDGLGDDEQNALTKGFPYIEAISGARPWEDDMPGIRWVEVVNLRRHVMSRLELSPGLNVLTGDINGGKSTLYFTALRAMAYGETDDTMIRHGADQAIVRVGLENDVVLEMVRSRKGSPKVLFRRYHSRADYLAGNPAHEGRQETRGGVPSFITDALKIERVDGLDIQLRSQKEPVFLLNETPSRRAQLLSVGRESGLLQALIERHRLQNRRDKEQVKRDEVELNLVTRTLTVMSPLARMAALVEIMSGLLDDVRVADAKLQSIRTLVALLSPLESRVQLLALVGDTLSAAPVAPRYAPTKPLADLVARLERSHQLAKLPDMPSAPSVPQYVHTKPLADLVARLVRNRSMALLPDLASAPVVPTLVDARPLQALLAVMASGQQAARVLSLLPASPVPPAVVDTTNLRRVGVSLASRKEALAVLEKDEKAVVAEVTTAEDALHQLKHKLGVCPTCSQAFPEKNHV